MQKQSASNEDWTHDLWFTRPTLCHWAIEALMGTDVKYFKSSWQPQQLTLVTHLVHIFDPTKYKWLNGLGVWFSLWVREVPGSNPGWAHCFFYFYVHELNVKMRKSCFCMPWPGFEPGLLRPQRRVLTTRRSRLETPKIVNIWVWYHTLKVICKEGKPCFNYMQRTSFRGVAVITSA